jgi:hypothetical protein
MTDLKPRFPIRRFDVFADFHRIQNEAKGMPESQAKGRAIWAAKVVAGRRYGSAPSGSKPEPREQRDEKRHKEADDEFRSVGGVLQTDAVFDKEVIDRMGRSFYDDVFHPAIANAFSEGKRYEDIRDQIRKSWA